mmetsp:Transcript_14725/g.22157  ORF Transcript_14725/g.22157 Transcript_14725/m.22157 type:complete len:571 (+) Transcript_14725:44-1756(+)
MAAAKNKRYSVKAKAAEADYGHAYRVFGITKETQRSQKSMLEWADETDWFDSKELRKSPHGKSKNGAQKSAVDMRTAIDAMCAPRLRALRRENLRPLINLIRGIDLTLQSSWLHRVSYSFHPTVQDLRRYETEGYTLAGILDAVDNRNDALKENLGCNPGQWQGLMDLYLRILRGEVQYGGDVRLSGGGNRGDSIGSGDDNQARIIGEHGMMLLSRNNNNSELNSNNNDGGGDIDVSSSLSAPPPPMPPSMATRMAQAQAAVYSAMPASAGSNDPASMHVFKVIPRGTDESSTNYRRKSRAGRRHPYFIEHGSSDTEFIAALYYPTSSSELQRFQSRLGDRYCYDDESNFFVQDKLLLSTIMNEQHHLKKLHARLTSQQHFVRHFTNKLIGNNDLRYPGYHEYCVAYTIGEYMELLRPIHAEAQVWQCNKIMIDAEPDEKGYKVDHWSNLYENGLYRLPRSKQQLKSSVTSHNSRWFLRVSPIKVKAEYEKAGKSEEEWDALVWKWKKFGVMTWLKQYLLVYFPDDIDRAIELNLVEETVVEQHDVLRVNNVAPSEDEQKQQDAALMDML